jgi:Ca2+-binding RTX toxin-like protein
MGKNCGRHWRRPDKKVGQKGDDHLKGGDGNDWLDGRAGHDRLAGGTGHDLLFGGRGDDQLSGGAGNDRLFGGRGHDQLAGGTGKDKLFGGAGNDTFTYRAGDGTDYVDGGNGTDVIRLDSVGGGWKLHLSCGRVVSRDSGKICLSKGAAGKIKLADGSIIVFRNIEQIHTVQEVPEPNETPEVPKVPVNQAPSLQPISAATVVENAANGSVVATVLASDPDAGDALTFALTDDAGGRFAIDPTTGVIMVADGTMLDFESADQHSVTVQVTDGGGLSHTLTTVIGVLFDNSGNDTLSGDAADNVIDGGTGDDVIAGDGGNDQLSGGGGDDELDGGDGDDLLAGDDGNDLLFGGDGDDQLSGGAGADQLHGGMGNDQMDGGDGDDSLFGNVGNDVMSGGAGNDRLFGAMGDDVLAGGDGDDTLSGSTGADRFVFDAADQGQDTVTDFGAGDVLVFTGLASFTAGREAEYVNLVQNGGSTTVLVDADGAANGSAFDPVAVLTGVTLTSLTDLVNAGRIDLWAA